MGEGIVRAGRQPFSAERDQLPGELARRHDGDLLTEHRSHRELETVPRAGRPQAGALRQQSSRGTGRATRCVPIVSISAPTSKTRRTRVRIWGRARTDGKRTVTARFWRVGSCRTSTVPHSPVVEKRAPIRAFGHLLDACQSRGLPERRAWSANRKAGGSATRSVTPASLTVPAGSSCADAAAQLTRGALKEGLEGFVEAAHRPEPGTRTRSRSSAAAFPGSAAWRTGPAASARPRPGMRRDAA